MLTDMYHKRQTSARSPVLQDKCTLLDLKF